MGKWLFTVASLGGRKKSSKLGWFEPVNVLHSEMSTQVKSRGCVNLWHFFSSTVSAEFLLSEEGGQNIVISDAFIKGRSAKKLSFPLLIIQWDDVKIWLTELQANIFLQSLCSTAVWRKSLKRCCLPHLVGTTVLWTSSERRTGRRRPWKGYCAF